MANYTRKAIIQMFEDMLHEMPFDKITVSEIVTRCDISSNTFYYHFHDIYDLLDCWLNIKEEKYFCNQVLEQDWKDILKMIFHDLQDHPDIVNHIFDSRSRERIEKYAYNSIETSIFQLVKERPIGIELSEEMQQMVTRVFCCTLFGFLIKFIWNGMDMDVDKAIDQLGEVIERIFDSIKEGSISGI